MAFSRDGRDYYVDPEGKLVSVDAGFDAGAEYPDLAPATQADVEARDAEKAAQSAARFDRTPASTVAVPGESFLAPRSTVVGSPGDIDPDAAFGASQLDAEQVEAFNALPPSRVQPFSRDGRDFYFDADGKMSSVDAGFDPSEDYPDLKPATAEQVHQYEIQKRSGSFGDRVANVAKTALATVAETASAVSRFGANDIHGDDAGYDALIAEGLASRPDTLAERHVPAKTLAPVAFTPKALEQREANPATSFVGAAVPDVLLNFAVPGSGVAATAARIAASSIVTEAGNTVIEGDEFSMGDAFGVYAPTQIVFEAVGGPAFRAVAKGFGWGKNTLSIMVERSRTNAVKTALLEQDPVKRAGLLVKEAPHILKQAQTELDEALGTIDARLAGAPDKLFTPSALKKTVSNSNLTAQADKALELSVQLSHAAEVTGDAALAKAATSLDNVRGSGGSVLYSTLRTTWQALDGAVIDSPLAREAVEDLQKTLGDATVWGRAAENHAAAMAETAAGGTVRGSVGDIATHDALKTRFEQARRVSSLTGDKTLSGAAQRGERALGIGSEVTGARIMRGKASSAEIDTMRKTLDAFPDKAPQIAASIAKGIDTLDGIAADILPDTWTLERIESTVVGRAAGSKAARLELNAALDHADEWIKNAKAGETHPVGTIARAEAQVNKLREALDEVDQIPKIFKTVRNFDANPRNALEKVVDAATGKVASKVAGLLSGPVAGAAAGYAGGGVFGAVAGAAAGRGAEHFIDPVIQAQAGKFGAWLKTALRTQSTNPGAASKFAPWLKESASKYGRPLAGVAAIYGANRLANDPDDPSPNAAATVGLLGLPLVLAGKGKGLRKLSGYLPLHAIEKELSESGREHLYALVKDAKVPTRLGTMHREYDASKIAITADGEPVVFNKQGYAQGTGRYRYQSDLKPKPKPKPIEGEARYAELEAWRETIAGIKREGAPIGEPQHRGLDTLPVNEKALTALAKKTGVAIKGLEPEEQVALLDYIEGGGAATFRALQKGAPPAAGKERYADALPAFESAVEKLQQTGLTEKVGPLWRGFHITPEDATRLVNSKVVETGALTSTSFKPFYAQDTFADTAEAKALGHVPVVLKFEHVERAAPISAANFSKQYGSGEREALLPSGSVFEVGEVTRRTWAYGGHIEVTLREVPKASVSEKVGFVLTGLLGLGAAATADEDSDSGVAAAGVGGLYLLFGGKKASALFAKRTAAAMGRIAADLGPELAKATDDVLDVFTKDAVELAAKGEVASKEEFAAMVGTFKSNLFEQVGWRVGERMPSPLTPELENEIGRYANTWADKTFADYAGGSRADDVLDGESIMWTREGGGQLGSNDGGTYRGGDGVKRYVKLYDTEQQAVGEHMANQIYRQAGIPAPRSVLFRTEEGQMGYASEWLKGGFDKKNLDDITVGEATQFAKGFWGDVLLANWDVTGMHHDNLVFPFAGGVYRIDNGSALKYRAQGAEKPAHLLDELSEIQGFFNPKLNRPYAALLDKAGVREPKQLLEYLPETIEGARHYLADPGPNADPELLGILERRVSLLEQYGEQLEAQRAVRRPTRLGDVVTKAPLPAALKDKDAIWFNNQISYELRRAPAELGKRKPADQARYLEYLAEESERRIEQRFADDSATRRAVQKFTLEKIAMLRENLAIEATLTAPPRLAVQFGDAALAFSDRLETHMQAAKALLTPKEVDAVRSFTGGSSEEIKNAMSGAPFRDTGYIEKVRAEILTLVPHLESAAQKLMFPTPTVDTPLYRGVNLPEAALHELLTVDRYSPASTLSVSNSVNVARDFARGDHRPVLLRFVHVEEAAPVMHISNMAHESEWFVPRGGAYDVKGRYYDEDRDLFVIDLAQVESASKPDITNAGALAIMLGLGAAASASGSEGDETGAAAAGVGLLGLGGVMGKGKGLRVPRLGAGAARGATAGAKHLVLDEMRQDREEDREQAAKIQAEAEEQAAGINEAREQALDETREKLGYLEHQSQALMQSAARQIASKAENDTDRTVERIPGVTSSQGIARFLGSHSNLFEAFTAKRQMLQALQRDPMALVEELADSFGELHDNAPELHAQVSAQTFRVAQYLQSKLPSTVGPSLVRPDGSPPSSMALRQFAIYYSAATDPSSVLGDLANNRARKEQVDTLRELWPDTYTRLKLAVVEQLAQGRPSFAQRSRLDLLFDFGQGFDRSLSPGLVATLATYRQAMADKGGGPGAGGKAAPSRRTNPSVGGASALGSLALGPGGGSGVG